MSNIDPPPVPQGDPTEPTPPTDVPRAHRLVLPPPSKPPRDWVRRFIVDYNPFFLLSALCMLGGSLALTNSMSWSPVRLQRILLLTATINVYELLLVALGLFLIRRRNARRDGAILLIVEAFFLVDVAFLNAELFAIDRWVGLIANVILLTLAIAKLATIFRLVGLRLSDPMLGIVLVEIVALFALPGVLKFYATASGGTLPPAAMFAVWWLLFLLGVGAMLILEHARRTADHSVAPWFAPLITILAGVSLAAHAGTSQWIYDLHYWGADLSPMLALAAFILCYRFSTRSAGVLCAMAALMTSASHNNTLRFLLLDHEVSPIHLTAIAVYVVLAWTIARRLFAWFIGIGLLAAITAFFGPSVAQIRQWFSDQLEWIVNVLDAYRPRTQTHWGIIAVVLSFAFLALGTVISVRREEDEESSNQQTS